MGIAPPGTLLVEPRQSGTRPRNPLGRIQDFAAASGLACHELRQEVERILHNLSRTIGDRIACLQVASQGVVQADV